MKRLFLFLSFVLVSTVGWTADQYSLDASHSTIGFSVTHLMVSQTTGQFNTYDGSVEFDANDIAKSKASITIDVSSIDTRNEARDTHLKNADFFDIAQFPSITFVSKSINKENMVGDLTIKGVTKEVTLPITISGPVVSPMGGEVIGLNGSFTINRQDYGVNWNKTMDKGGLAVANDVKVNISIEAHKK